MVGHFDDVRDLSAAPRLGAQVLAGTVVGARAGGIRGAVLGALTLPAVINAFNFMDGINGISGGTAVSWGLTVLTDPLFGRHIVSQGALAAGMGFGFLPYNVPRASMFLGDVGSYFLGSGIATTVVQASFSNGSFEFGRLQRVLAPLALYLADTGSAIVRRGLRGEPLAEAHSEHVYQKLVREIGLPHWGAAGVITLGSALCGLAGRWKNRYLGIGSLVACYLLLPSLLKAAYR
ncbi:hypothetical protein JTP68_11545 [Dietzia cinnamea]|nr:hypothetical protein [Dietzia cinnamea]